MYSTAAIKVSQLIIMLITIIALDHSLHEYIQDRVCIKQDWKDYSVMNSIGIFYVWYLKCQFGKVLSMSAVCLHLKMFVYIYLSSAQNSFKITTSTLQNF